VVSQHLNAAADATVALERLSMYPVENATRKFRFFDIFRGLPLEMLHNEDCGTFKSMALDWLPAKLTMLHGAKGANEILDCIDARFARFPQVTGFKSFHHGLSSLNNPTASELRAAMVVMPFVFEGLDDSATLPLAELFTSYVRWYASIRSPVLSASQVQRQSTNHIAFRRLLASTLGDASKTGLRQPKIHYADHVALFVERFGMPSNYCADGGEHGHIEFAKDPYRHSNKKHHGAGSHRAAFVTQATAMKAHRQRRAFQAEGAAALVKDVGIHVSRQRRLAALRQLHRVAGAPESQGYKGGVVLRVGGGERHT
jgi:hypothetical protein